MTKNKAPHRISQIFSMRGLVTLQKLFPLLVFTFPILSLANDCGDFLNNIKSQALVETQSALPENKPEELFPLDIIKIRDRVSGRPSVIIPAEQLQYRYESSQQMSYITLEVLGHGDPSALLLETDKTQIPQLGFQNLQDTSENIQNQRSLIQKSQEVATQNKTSLASNASDTEVVRQYLRNQLQTQNPSDATIEDLVGVMVKNKDFIIEARNALTKDNSSKEIIIPTEKIFKEWINYFLTNWGQHRYFWFRPEGHDQYVPARVLDIHREVWNEVTENATEIFDANEETISSLGYERNIFESFKIRRPVLKGYSLLIEYIIEEEQDGYKRVRNIAQMTLDEFKTILNPVNNEKYSYVSAEQVFREYLTPIEIQTLKLAQQMNLMTFGFYDPRRTEENRNNPSAFWHQTNILYVAISKHLIDTFGIDKIENILTSEEKEQKNYSPYGSTVIDFAPVFSRLSPKEILRDFFDYNTRYYWVITEDGLLKIMPAQDLESILPVQAHRLAGSKRVFAAGVFNVDPVTHELYLELDAKNYQLNTLDSEEDYIKNGYYYAREAFEQEGDIAAFVHIVFNTQLGAKILNLTHSQQVDPMMQAFFNGEFSFKDHGTTSFSFEYGRWDSTSTKKNTPNTHTATSNDLIWDITKSSLPLSLSEYEKQMKGHSNASNMTLAWSHYILGTSNQMNLLEIKAKYKERSKMFHPDVTDKLPKEDAEVVMKYLNTAYDFIKKMY